MAGSIITIGYGNRSLQELIDLLRRESIQYLVDVRTSPRSRFKPEFSAEPLDAALRAAGIRYVFMGDTLGGRPPDTECYEGGHVVYSIVREKPFFKAGIERLLTALRQDLKVCLLCSEGRPTDCHRSKLIGAALAAIGVSVDHLGLEGEKISQAEVIASLESPQGDLFGQSLRSRKAYSAKTMTAGSYQHVRTSDA
ncbi:MAG: DUF488 family protein [Bryobacteraceae bacterium]